MKSANKNQIINELDAPVYREASRRTMEVINFYLARGRYMQSAFVVNLLNRWWRKLKNGTARARGCAGEYGLEGELAGHPVKIRSSLEW